MARDTIHAVLDIVQRLIRQSLYICMHATKQHGDGTAAQSEPGRACEEATGSPGHASHGKSLCAHVRGSRIQLKYIVPADAIYICCRTYSYQAALAWDVF